MIRLLFCVVGMFCRVLGWYSVILVLYYRKLFTIFDVNSEVGKALVRSSFYRSRNESR